MDEQHQGTYRAASPSPARTGAARARILVECFHGAATVYGRLQVQRLDQEFHAA